MGFLVIVEHDGAQVRAGSRSALGMAFELAAHTGEAVELLVLGSRLEAVATDAARFATTIVADDPCLEHPTADRYARVIAEVAEARGGRTIVAAATTFAKD